MTDVEPRPLVGGMLRRRQCLVPTWRGWLVLLVAGMTVVTLACRTVHPFLAVNAPLSGGVLVVEGWLPDYALKTAIAEFQRGLYSRLYVTGGPLDQGAPLSEYRTYAELGAATLIRMGLSKEAVQAVPAPTVLRDRTYAAAVALNAWLLQHGARPTNFNILSLGVHGRRSRLLFEKALGGSARVGILTITDQSYDAQRWWTSSPGVRTVIGEAIAYGYVRLLFRAP